MRETPSGELYFVEDDRGVGCVVTWWILSSLIILGMVIIRPQNVATLVVKDDDRHGGKGYKHSSRSLADM